MDFGTGAHLMLVSMRHGRRTGFCQLSRQPLFLGSIIACRLWRVCVSDCLHPGPSQKLLAAVVLARGLTEPAEARGVHAWLDSGGTRPPIRAALVRC